MNARPDVGLIEELCVRIFGPARERRVVPVAEGVSTYVFRVERGREVFYLRVLPEDGASFAPEVLAHHLLLERGARVPHVVYWEHYNSLVDRSVMLTTEIKGQPIGHGADALPFRDVLLAAGRDLALANALPVWHFGWIRRDRAGVTTLEGEMPALQQWLLADLDARLASLLRHGVFPPETISAIRAIVARARSAGLFDEDQAYLAHGDFDATHIYHHAGTYSGIIDWGEIRGTQPLYDLGHFAVENAPLLPYVLEGYREVAQLPPDFELRIQLASLLMPLERLALGLDRRPDRPIHAPYVGAVHRAIRALRS